MKLSEADLSEIEQRLLLAGTHVLRTGQVLVDMSPHRERLLAIKNGALPWAEVTAWADDLLHRLDEAAAGTGLPTDPDRATVDDLLAGICRRSLT